MFVAEFVFRGRHESEGQPAAFHARLGDAVARFGQTQIIYSEPMTPEALEAAGFPLTAIVADLNAQALADSNSLRARLTAAEAALAAANTRADEAEAALAGASA